MIERKTALTSKAVPLLVILVLTAGCVGGLLGSGPSDTPENGQASGEDDRPFPGVNFGLIERQNNDSGVVLEGTFVFSLLPEDNRTFDDVVVCLYDESGAVLYANTTSVTGPVERKNISIRLNESPSYMIVDHPAFSEIEEFSKEYIHFDGKINRKKYEFSSLPFEYPRHNETGRCR